MRRGKGSPPLPQPTNRMVQLREREDATCQAPALTGHLCRMLSLDLLVWQRVGDDHQDSCFSCLVRGSSSGNHIPQPGIKGGLHEFPPIGGEYR